jgi:mono/diheme cytochrome c family protein
MRWWRAILCGLAALAVIIGIAIGLARWADAPSDAAETPAHDVAVTPDMITRGAYLARAGDCSGCHTVPGGLAYAGGLPMQMPFGTIYASNITPDPNAGIGRWSDADFLAAMHRGISRDGHHLYPAFPYNNFTKMPVADILAIKAFLFSQKPVAQAPPKNDIAFPFNQRWGIVYWNLLFNSNKRFQPDPARSAEVNRGAYLVEGPGHCGGCHTPRNLFYAEKGGKAFAGGVAEKMRAYNISSDPVWGIGRWSDEALIEYMRDSYAPAHGAAGASMALVVQESLSHLSDTDLRAIVAYLRQTRRQAGGVRIVPNPVGRSAGALLDAAVEPEGRVVYAGACAGCHGWGGTGPATPSPLLGNRSVNDPEGLNIMAVLLRGIHLKTPRGQVHMPAFAEAYSDAELAAATRYVVAAFGPGGSHVTSRMVDDARKP